MSPILLRVCFQNIQKLSLLWIYILCCQEYCWLANDYIHRSHYNTFAPAFMLKSSILSSSSSTKWWGAILPDATSFTTILWHFTEPSSLLVVNGPTIHHPYFALYGFGAPFLLDIISIGSNPFMQFAPICIPTSILSIWVITLENGFKYSYLLVLSSLAISSLYWQTILWKCLWQLYPFHEYSHFAVNCWYYQCMNCFSVCWFFTS